MLFNTSIRKETVRLVFAIFLCVDTKKNVTSETRARVERDKTTTKKMSQRTIWIIFSVLIILGFSALALQPSLLFGVVEEQQQQLSSAHPALSAHFPPSTTTTTTIIVNNVGVPASPSLAESSSVAATDLLNNIDQMRARARGREYTFDLCRPRRRDEEEFFHLSDGGLLRMPSFRSPLWHQEGERGQTLRKAAQQLYNNFLAFDNESSSKFAIPVYGTACIGIDCGNIFYSLSVHVVAIGHVIVVVGESASIDANNRAMSASGTIQSFNLLAAAFPGRFTVFHRPEKPSCAESWNLILRMAFSIRAPDQIEFCFIVNADFTATGGRRNSAGGGGLHPLSRFAAEVRSAPHLAVHRFHHFTSFALTKHGFLELGYFDETLFPAYAEDVELHLRAVSKNMAVFGRFDSLGLFTHARQKSLQDPEVAARKRHLSRDVYIYRKWGVKIAEHQDFALAKPFKSPFNLPTIAHNNSWRIDPEQRRCILEMAAISRKFSNDELRQNSKVAAAPMQLQVLMKHGARTRLCYFNASAALRPLLPANIRDSFEFPASLMSMEHEF